MIPLLVFDTNLNLLAQIDDYGYLRWERKWRKPHNFEIQINRYKKHVEYLTKGNFVAIYRDGKYRAGMIELREQQLTQEGKISENLKIAGRSLALAFENRIALNNVSVGNGHDIKTDVAERVMRYYVNLNCISPSDPNRIIPNLTLATDLGRGKTITYNARFQLISQILEEISIRSGLGYDVTLDLTSGNFVFEVLQGRNLATTQTVNSPVIFSPDYDNIQTLAFRDSIMDSKNFAVVAGQGVGELRTIVTVGTATGLARREEFIDARDLATTAELTERGEERLEETKEEVSMEFDHLPGGPFKYMEDFDLGDIVTVIYPDIATLHQRIFEVTEEITPEGQKERIGVGKEWPDLIRLIKRDRKNIDSEVRR